LGKVEYIQEKNEASRAMVDVYNLLGYLSGLFFVKPDMDATTLLRTVALVHLLDAILCRVIAAHNGRQKHLWTAAGLLFGIWALGILFFLPAKKRNDVSEV